ncbi:peptidoglycan endopeptidase [Streptomyces sp. WAC05374]|uniref:C40 family peptidase n=1 Tax=Streptomyces sp. WAC05374 TaxID=2487420 RepID=UPI000F89ACEA|nr:C40 family peptidase [Streptomyces sp. WAC05374]RST11512.1 peptidoglycan endopeptidase [Streptomyces sp. WAC05374]TDF43904.1 peptidoglycan endopeptidase [Streptomyces sp. WAC05374]TDF51929.1 peptidoglycan endopeptidase [Streptomyces sp. WAC05374]TDF54284.1 peptidoglycan endopeptidase [Streptomyces sp. WAC05374]
MKAVAAGIGVVFLSPLLLAGTAMMMASSAEAVQTSGSFSGCLTDIDSDEVAKHVTDILDGASGKDVHIEGLDLPAEQVPNARTIVATGISLDVPKKGQIIALATAMQESRLRNLNYGDRDSLGLFQQRPSQGWGTAQQIRDPVYASERFYKALLKVNGWQQMTVTQAAQAVQKSGYPDAYAQWENLATALQTAIAKTFPGNSDSSGKDKDGQKPDKEAESTTGCSPSKDGSGFGRIPEGSVPKGYKIPKDADPKARKALDWAMHQLGTQYQWGGSCTAAHGPDPMGRCDCSSLMQQAYAHAGITLTRTTYTQVNEGKPVSPSHLQPGDLVFSRGTASRPEHVGMYMGEGLVIEAPRTGKPVRITPIKDWDILAARRVL